MENEASWRTSFEALAALIRREIHVPVPDEIRLLWDEVFVLLWDASLSAALEAAGRIYTKNDYIEGKWPAQEEAMVARFWRTLTTNEPHLPETPDERYQAVLIAVWMVLRATRTVPDARMEAKSLAIALRPVRHLQAGSLTPELCAALYDYHRGIWTPFLTKPQLWIIRTALARTIAALPPDRMEPFWEAMQSPDPAWRQAMLLGLEFLSAAHAVPHLLVGLEQSTDHIVRTAIVDCLEKIADPRAIALLTRLRQETAHDDWTLSRQMARAIRVIEGQNRGQNHRTLLRATDTPEEDSSTLLHPSSHTEEHAHDRATLLRSPEAAEELSASAVPADESSPASSDP